MQLGAVESESCHDKAEGWRARVLAPRVAAAYAGGDWHAAETLDAQLDYWRKQLDADAVLAALTTTVAWEPLMRKRIERKAA